MGLQLAGSGAAANRRTAEIIGPSAALLLLPQGTLACLIVLSALALLALALAAAHRRRLRRQPGGAGAGWAASPVLHVGAWMRCVSSAAAWCCLFVSSALGSRVPPASPPLAPRQVAPTLASLLLIEVSGAARVRALYQPTVTTNDQLYYTLIVLPELLQQLAAAVPTLLHRCGLAEAYAQRGWRSCTWGWVARAFPAANAAPLEAGGAQEAAPAAGKGDVDCGSSAGGAPSSAGSLKGSGRGGAPPA